MIAKDFIIAKDFRSHSANFLRRAKSLRDHAGRSRYTTVNSGAMRSRRGSGRAIGCCYGVQVESDSAVAEQFPVSGAHLYTEARGAGPLLLFIVGGNGDPAVFSGVAGRLAGDFTVVTYARRGFVGSPVDGPIDDANRIAADVEDAVALIARHGGGPACVFGSSSGAIVALDLVARHPDRVSTAVVHEPPILELLDDPGAWADRLAGIFATYETAGLWPAMAQFGQAVGLGGPAAPPPGAEAAPEVAAMRARAEDNMTFWMEHEFRQYPAYHPDLDALAAIAEKIVPAGGRDSRKKGSMPFLPVVTLAGRLGRDIAEFAGGHVGYAEEPGDFAAQLGRLLGADR
jgi:pimeloyl-ACP methyl ester carboxylesterase